MFRTKISVAMTVVEVIALIAIVTTFVMSFNQQSDTEIYKLITGFMQAPDIGMPANVTDIAVKVFGIAKIVFLAAFVVRFIFIKFKYKIFALLSAGAFVATFYLKFEGMLGSVVTLVLFILAFIFFIVSHKMDDRY